MQEESRQDKYVVVSAEDQSLDSGQHVARGAQRRQRCYKPLTTKSPFLLLILAAILLCIILLEVVVQHGTRYTGPEDTSGTRRKQVRSQAAAASSISTTATSSDYLTSVSTTSDVSVPTTPYMSDPASVLTLTSSSSASTTPVSPTETTIPGAGLTITSTTTTSTTPLRTTTSTLSSSTTTSQFAFTSTTGQGAVLTITSTSTLSSSTTTSQSAIKSTTGLGAGLTITSTSTGRTLTQTGGSYLSLITTTSIRRSTTIPAYISSTGARLLSSSLSSNIVKSRLTTDRDTSSTSAANTGPTTSMEKTETKPPGSYLSLTSSVLSTDVVTSTSEHVYAVSTTVSGTLVGTETDASYITSTGTQSTGTQPTGTQSTGTQPTGTQPTGTKSTGPTTQTAVTTSAENGVASYLTVLTTTTDESGRTTSYYLVIEKTTEAPRTTVLATQLATGSSQSTELPAASSQLTLTATSSVAPSSTSGTDTYVLNQVKVAGPFTKMDYFSALYLGPFIAVGIKIVWDVVFSSTKMMEPFYQLAKTSGASPEDSLCADYLSSGLSWTSIKLMLNGHWVMLLTTGIYISIGLLAPLASEAMTVKAGGFCATPLSPHQPCNPVWVVDVTVVRGLEAFLALTATLIVVLMFISYQRKSGVYSNPSSIASMAALLGEQNVLEDFQSIDPQASPEMLRMALAGKRYALTHYETSTGVCRYGITKMTATLNERPSQNSMVSEYLALSNPANDTVTPQRRPIPWLLIIDILFILSVLALFGIILGYYLDGKGDPFNNFFNSGTFGPRFVLTTTATLIDSQWKRLEREVRIAEPYHRLRKRRASPAQTVLATMNGTPATTLPIALWYGNFFHAWVALIAILSDVLIIAVAGVPFNGGQIRPVLLASCYASLTILGLMFCTIVAIFLWRLRAPKIPRSPDTLACVWMYLCASRMVDDFHGMELVGTELRDEAVKRSGRKYWFGLALGKGGQERWMIDHEWEGRMAYY